MATVRSCQQVRSVYAVEKFQQLWPKQVNWGTLVLFASHCTLVLPPCASMCHYSGTSQIRNTKNHVLIREVPLYYYLIVATIQRLQQCACIYSEEGAKERECDLIGDWKKSLMNHPLLVCDIYK